MTARKASAHAMIPPAEGRTGATEAASPSGRVSRPLPPYVPVRPGLVNAFVARVLMSPPQRLLAILRLLWPIPRVFDWAAVLRYDDVAEVLGRHDVFRVPFGNEIARLNDGVEPGTPFMLGIDDPAEHGRQANLVMQAFRFDDIDAVVAPASHASARRRLRNARRGSFDAISQLVTAVPLDICREYYGVDIAEEGGQAFAYATIELSGHLFGFPPIEPSEAGTEDSASAYVRTVVDRSIEREIAAPSGGKTVLARLAHEHNRDPAGLPTSTIRAVLIGMITGFVPTNTMAGGHILEMLLRKPDMLNRAQQAAQAGDDDRLMRCLFEALRFMPINLGPFRVCSRDHRVAPDSARAATIRAGTRVLAMTSSAMFDSRHVGKPFKFDPGRPASNYMHFGFGMHWCVGSMIARAQITQTFKALLAHPGLDRAPGRAGRLGLWGLFPDHLYVVFDQE
jgi:cytochrome P450